MPSILEKLRLIDDPAERRAYFAEEIRRMDEQSMIEAARAKGYAEGYAEGVAKTKERMVRTFLEKWPDMNKAVELLGLDLEEVRRIAKKFSLLAANHPASAASPATPRASET